MKSTKKALVTLMGVVLLLTLVPLSGYPAVPLQITYQGYLTDPGGNPVPDGDYLLSFGLYDVSTGDTALWAEAQTVTVTNGIYTVILGQPGNELDPTDFDGDLYLGVTVGTDAEMSPRQPLTSVGYALRAAVADSVKEGAVTTIMIEDGAVETAKLADNAITESKIEDGTVTTVKLQDGATLLEISDNDGAGSGLDADKVDGFEASAFASAIHDHDAEYVNVTGDSMSGSSSGALLSVANTGVGHGVYGYASNTGDVTNYGGYFRSAGSYGRGVYSYATGSSGMGVYGYASNTGDFTNYGGYFRAAGSYGRGVYSYATGGYGRGVYSHATGGYGMGVYGYASNTGDFTNYGGYFSAAGSSGRGVFGYASNTGDVTNYGGYFSAAGSSGRGVYGYASNTGDVTNYGGYFSAAGTYGNGVYGYASGSSGVGVYGVSGGTNGYGVQGYVGSTGGVGVVGLQTTAYSLADIGVWRPAGFFGGRNGVIGVTKEDSGYGVYGQATGSYTRGFYGRATGDNVYGVYGYASAGTGEDYPRGVYGRGYGDNATGVTGSASGGTNPRGVYGYAPIDTGYAGYFEGNVYITGALFKGGGSFKIDHPLDPENKYLSHSFVESPDMMNIYNGNVVLDEKGEAWVELPDWFEALNRDFRYQLTCIGGFAPVYIAEEISENRFMIAGGRSAMKVSWQVTGIRNDPWAKAYRIPVESDKPEEERGYYLHPEVYGKPEESSVEWARDPEMMQRMRKEAHTLLEPQE